MINDTHAATVKKLYPNGTRVELIRMNDQYARIDPGTQGTVRLVDSLGTIHVSWDDGSSLGLIPGEDHFRTIG